MVEQFIRPPLGEKPDFEKIDKEKVAEVLGLKYYDVERYSDIVNDLEITIAEVNKIKKDIGVPITEIDIKQVRLIKQELFESSRYYRYDKSGGFYDDESGNILVPFNNDKFIADKSYNIDVRYRLIHEMVHKSMLGQGIHKDFYRINEGLVDTIAREIMENNVIPNLVDENDKLVRSEFIKNNPSVTIEGDDVPVETEDIAFVEKGKIPVSYRRIQERRLIGKIKQTKPEVYKLLLKSAFAGDNDEARAILVQNYGEQILNDLKNTRMKFLLEQLD